MSHNKDESIICPNCGFEANNNYCAQCGQPTQLHKETFPGLIVHFVAHYFHYDSKFFRTIKTLILKPGQLTLAYWNNQRMRFIPPISLYIFVSSLFFILSFFIVDSTLQKIQKGEFKQHLDSIVITNKNIDSKNLKDTAVAKPTDAPQITTYVFGIIKETVHHAPKVLFFMVPFYALMLQLLFIRRKELYFVDHAIFSLHVHSFWFTLLFIQLLIAQIPYIGGLFFWFVPCTGIAYMVLALHKTYKMSAGKALVYGIATVVLYITTFVMIVLIALMYYIPKHMPPGIE